MADLASTARVRGDEVKEIFDTDLTGTQLNIFINSAHRLVNSLLSTDLTTDLLTEIELWLAAHFAAIRDPRVQQESVAGEWSATYQGKTGEGLRATTYGQQAIALDTTGKLGQLDSTREAGLEVFSEADMYQ